MDIPDTVITKNAEETQGFGYRFADNIIQNEALPRMVFLHGELGSGKTTFVQGFAKQLGITDRIISPTFIIMRRYGYDTTFLYHLDLYRIETNHDIESLGIHEIFDDPSYPFILVEWPEKLEKLPKAYWDLKFTTLDDETHMITIKQIKA